jgi:hypothetical protein
MTMPVTLHGGEAAVNRENHRLDRCILLVEQFS